MFKRYLIVLVLLTGYVYVHCQTLEQSAAEIVNDVFEQYSAESEENVDYESFYNDLISLMEHPLDLNNLTREQCEKLAFLSEIQIENILYYIYQNGGLNTIYELQLIEGIDMTDIRRMLPFVMLGQKNNNQDKLYFNEVVKYGKSNLYLRVDKGLEQKKGFITYEDENGVKTSPYIGSPYYNSLKYSFDFKNRVKFGITMEKDPGEQFNLQKTGGFDFYSFHFQIGNIGKIKNLVLGDYRASFGQGLVFSSGYGLSKSALVTNIVSRENGLKKFSSTDEFNYLRGIGSTIKLKKLEITCFYSNKMIDADTLGNTFRSIYKSGLHRTESEILKRRTVNQQLLAMHAGMSFNQMRLGFTMAHTKLANELLPDSESYNLYYFRGKIQNTASVDYKVRLAKFNLFGETAVTGNSGVASVNGLLISPVSTINLVGLWRYYSPGYDTFYANAFSESTRTNNENGLYLGAEMRTFKNWKFSFYVDSYRFMWLKFGVNAPSIGQDYLLQIDYSPKRNLYMNWRIKHETKQGNSANQIINYVTEFTKSSARYQFVYSLERFTIKNLVEVNYSDSASFNKKFGFAASQDLSYTFSKIPVGIDIRYMFFDSPTYDNRFYFYEKDVFNVFSIPVLSGVGSRFYVNLKYNIAPNFSCWLKFAQTIFSDGRLNSGTAYDQIAGNKKSDIRLLINYVF